MKTLARFSLMLVALVALCTLAPNANAQTGPIYWKTKLLNWQGLNVPNRNFTAAADSGFLTLPSDIAWDLFVNFSGLQNFARLTFQTSAAAANADTVRYVLEPGYTTAAGVTVYGQADFGSRTPGLSNCATIARGADGGLIFVGVLQMNSASQTSDLQWIPPGNSRIKVTNDPNGALANLRCQITYPSHNPN